MANQSSTVLPCVIHIWAPPRSCSTSLLWYAGTCGANLSTNSREVGSPALWVLMLADRKMPFPFCRVSSFFFF